MPEIKIKEIPFFSFNSETHTYTLGNIILPSITQLLKLNELLHPEFFTKQAAERGKAIHKATELHDKSAIGTDDPAILAYLKAYQSFLADSGFRPTIIEKPMYHEKLKVAGTPDRLGFLNKRRILLEIKTTQKPYPIYCEYQLAGQKLITEDFCNFKIQDCFVLYLRQNHYKLVNIPKEIIEQRIVKFIDFVRHYWEQNEK